MSTEFSDIYSLFYDKIQKDPDFFLYNNVLPTYALVIANQRSKGYLIESISKLILNCTPDIDFTDFDITTQISATPLVLTAKFNITLTFTEQDILASLMFEKYLDKDMCILKALGGMLTPKDMNVFSPANERKTFIEMLNIVKKDNLKLIKSYASRDRLTNALKLVTYTSSDDEVT